MSLSRIPGPVGEITVDGNPTRVQSSTTIAHDLRIEPAIEVQERRIFRSLNYNPPPPKPGFKYCSNCGLEQRVSTEPQKSAFSPYRYARDGYHSWCKSCRNAQARRWRATQRSVT